MPLGGSVHAGGQQGQALGLGGGQRTAEMLGGIANLPGSRVQQLFANYIAQKDKRAKKRNANTSAASNTPGFLDAIMQAVNSVKVGDTNVPYSSLVEQGIRNFLDPKYGEGYYGSNVTQMGMQNPNLAIAGSASGLVNQTPGYADAQGYSPGYVNENFDPMGSSHMGQNSPMNSAIQATGSSPGIFNGAGFSNFSSANQPADDFANLDPSSFITETAESGEEFNQAAWNAQINAMLAEELAYENEHVQNNLESVDFTPATDILSAGTVGGGPRITGGLMGRKAPGEFSVPTDDNPGGIDGGGGEIRRRSRTPNYAAYVDMYDDLLAAQPSNMSKADWGRRHWERHGGQEGRRFGPAGMPMVSGPRPDPGDYFSSGPNVAIADPRPANPVEYGNAFQGVRRPTKTRRLSPQEAGGWA